MQRRRDVLHLTDVMLRRRRCYTRRLHCNAVSCNADALLRRWRCIVYPASPSSLPVTGMFLPRAEQNQSNPRVFKSAFGHFRDRFHVAYLVAKKPSIALYIYDACRKKIRVSWRLHSLRKVRTALLTLHHLHPCSANLKWLHCD